jgi:hypothetical protein
LCWFIYEESWSTFSSNNVHKILDDNHNPYRNMDVDAMRINQGYVSECSIVDEKPSSL